MIVPPKVSIHFADNVNSNFFMASLVLHQGFNPCCLSLKKIGQTVLASHINTMKMPVYITKPNIQSIMYVTVFNVMTLCTMLVYKSS